MLIQLWPPTVAVNSPTGPIHGYPTTPINGRDQQLDRLAIQHHALLPNDEPRSTNPIPCFHAVATCVTVDSTTTKPNVTTGTNKGTNQILEYLRESNIDLENRLEDLEVPKTKVLLMQEAREIEFKEQYGEILIALCLKKLISCKLDLQVASSPNSGNSAVAIDPLVGLVKATPVGKGKGLKRKAPS